MYGLPLVKNFRKMYVRSKMAVTSTFGEVTSMSVNSIDFMN